jgi:hypothetical protein
MAERKSSQQRSRRGGSGGAAGNGGRSRGSRDRRLSGPDAVAKARSQLPELLGRPIEAVLGMERDGDGAWAITVQVIELARIPNSTDVLGIYRAMVDDDGNLTGYRRIRRSTRSQADEE